MIESESLDRAQAEGREQSTRESCELGRRESLGMGYRGCACWDTLVMGQSFPEAGLRCGVAGQEFASCWSAPETTRI